MTPSPGIELGTHRRKASALTTAAPTVLPRISIKYGTATRVGKMLKQTKHFARPSATKRNLRDLCFVKISESNYKTKTLAEMLCSALTLTQTKSMGCLVFVLYTRDTLVSLEMSFNSFKFKCFSASVSRKNFC